MKEKSQINGGKIIHLKFISFMLKGNYDNLP